MDVREIPRHKRVRCGERRSPVTDPLWHSVKLVDFIVKNREGTAQM